MEIFKVKQTIEALPIPHGVTIKMGHNYVDLSITDSSDDTGSMNIDHNGVVLVNSNSAFGVDLSPEVLEYMWRISRIIRDLPWA